MPYERAAPSSGNPIVLTTVNQQLIKATGTDCDPSYPNVCIPSPPPDLDCPDITHRNFTVTGDDPHGFDGDADGLGCEAR
ncbi:MULTISPECIES: hypothetical protein [Cyanophyceae]|uniref:hypothetical protein n=1 Tax=Cyanophyceae TaxID=3028117 RepID=UPI0018EFBBD8|nr:MULTISPECIES: hypothetical protein [Cyanophyceae]